jgi:tetratricopeptide (TPR) repeat protein
MDDRVDKCGELYILESRQPFSSSLIWRLQGRYFAERGVEAWRQGEVPHYVTSNPTIANAYAEIAFAFRRDRQRLACADESGPLTICELGAGSGRFAFHFLNRLGQLCEQEGMALESFRYVLTDVAESNLAFWRRHRRFQDFFARGVLDIAAFDVMRSDALELQASGGRIEGGGLPGPLMVLANYLFDSVPQDLFHLQDGSISRCLASLAVQDNPETLDAAALLATLQIHYDDEPLAGRAYEQAWLQGLLDEYRHSLRDTHLLFPAAGLRCLDRLAALSPHGLLVLSADKGMHRRAALDGRPPPGLVRHGSVSLPVNYHAFTRFCEQRGGLALIPTSHHHSICVTGLVLLAQPERYRETRNAYRRTVREFGPDDFYTITKQARQHLAQLSAADILAYLRLSHHDSHQFGRYLPRLRELAPDFDAATKEDVADAVDRVWDLYFPLGEELDLANGIAGLLYEMDDYPRALTFFRRSIEIYGRDTGTLFNMAACHHLLGQDAPAAALLRDVIERDPENREAAALLARLGTALPVDRNVQPDGTTTGSNT